MKSLLFPSLLSALLIGVSLAAQSYVGRELPPIFSAVNLDNPSSISHVKSFECGVLLDVFEVPVLCSDGHTYSRSVIPNLSAMISPFSREQLSRISIYNEPLYDLMRDWSSVIYPSLLTGVVPESVSKWSQMSYMCADDGRITYIPTPGCYPNRRLMDLALEASAIANSNQMTTRIRVMPEAEFRHLSELLVSTVLVADAALRLFVEMYVIAPFLRPGTDARAVREYVESQSSAIAIINSMSDNGFRVREFMFALRARFVPDFNDMLSLLNVVFNEEISDNNAFRSIVDQQIIERNAEDMITYNELVLRCRRMCALERGAFLDEARVDQVLREWGNLEVVMTQASEMAENYGLIKYLESDDFVLLVRSHLDNE